MTRRVFIRAAATAATPSVARSSAAPLAPGRLQIPLRRVIDSRARVPPERLRHFWSAVWPEAFRSFSQSGIDLQIEDATGEVRRSAADRPIFVGLRRGVLNLVLTDHIPMYWDRGRSLAGVTTVYDGYHICLVAMLYAHGNQAPYLATNTCVHELMHALMQDILVSHPKWYQVSEREFRADWCATQLWLFHDGEAVRKSARVYLERVQSTAR